MVSLARKNLLEDIPRFLVAQAGILFAVTLVTIQLGIFSGFSKSTVKLIENSNADIWVASDTLVQLELTLPVPVSELIKARKMPEVARGDGLIFSGAHWFPKEGELVRVRIIGFNPQSSLYQPETVLEGSVSNLTEPYTAMIDIFDQNTLQVEGIGDQLQMSSLPVEVVGMTEGNTSMISNPFVLMSLKNANAYLRAGQTSQINCQLPEKGSQLECINMFHPEPDDQATTIEPNIEPRNLAASDVVTFILIKAESGQDLSALKDKLEQKLNNVKAYTKEELINITETYWQQRTGIGLVLGLGTVVGIVVGTVVVSQILYSSVSDHLKEFGTLKAMGASAGMIYRIIIEQAVWMAIFGYLPAMLLSFGVAYWINSSQGTLLLITPTSAIAIFVITMAMCIGSAIFAIQKVNRVDPAIVFKA